ncbi:EipB family protein [Camelimonas abortus]|uniref:EipB family protein n=1 Tax=Camelimonas abortus TaxID=1017184 RepID=A0ABV7LEG8_9HYPH
MQAKMKAAARSVAGCAMAAALAAGVWGAAAAAPAGGRQTRELPPLAPHEAVYALSLADGRGRFASAGGEVAYSYAGDACAGYDFRLRQELELEPHEGEPVKLGVVARTAEDAAGARLRFRQATVRGQGEAELVEGSARRTGGAGEAPGLAVSLTAPQAKRLAFSGEILFPAAYTRRLLAAARAGERTMAARLYEPGENGETVYDVFAVIGPRAPAGPGRKTGEAGRRAGLDRLDRWPVTVSYYGPGPGERTPEYSVAFDLYDNGVSGDMRLNLGEVSLDAKLTGLKVTGDGRCAAAARRK